MSKVFISSVIEGFDKFRLAAREAVDTAGMRSIMAENFPALPYSPDKACIQGVQKSDLLILILGERYGHEVEQGVSATKAEYLEAKKLHKDILVFVQKDITMEDKQDAFRKEVEEYISGFQRASFSTPENLKDCISKSLDKWKDSQAATSDTTFTDRIRAELPQHPPGQESFASAGQYLYPWAVVAFWGQPIQALDLESIDTDNEFKKFCEINANLSGGYDPPRISSNSLSFTFPRRTRSHSEHMCSKIRYYDDGLILLHFTPKTEFYEGGCVSYILSREFKLTVEGAWSLNRANSSWALVGLYNVGSALYFDKPSTPASQTPPTYRQGADATIENWKLFNPMRKEAYLRWVEEWVKKVKIKFSYNQFSTY